MSYTHEFTRQIKMAGGVIVSASKPVISQQEVKISDNVAASTTNALYALVIDVSQMQSLYIVASTAAVLKTNSSSVPGNTITLIANQAVEWITGDSGTCPLTVDVTALYVTVGAVGTAGCDLQIIALVDPTV